MTKKMSASPKSSLKGKATMAKSKLSKLNGMFVGENGDVRRTAEGAVVAWATKDGTMFGDFLPGLQLNRIRIQYQIPSQSSACDDWTEIVREGKIVNGRHVPA